MSLVTKPNIRDADAAYAALIAAHRGLSEEESVAFNARLILVLMNQIGDEKVLREALDLARDAGK